MKKIRTIMWLYLITACCPLGSILAEDWPTYQHDNRRSATTTEKLDFPMKQIWVYQSPAPLQTAWADSRAHLTNPSVAGHSPSTRSLRCEI